MSDSTPSQTRHTAGAFDIRTFIATLMGLFGVILLLAGLIGATSGSTPGVAGGSLNVWVGVGLIVFGVLMQGWAMARPTLVEESQLTGHGDTVD